MKRTLSKVKMDEKVKEAIYGLEQVIKEKQYEWLESMVGEKGKAQVGEFLVMRTTWEQLKEKLYQREERQLKEANQRIQALEQELKEYKANAKDIHDACKALGLKM